MVSSTLPNKPVAEDAENRRPAADIGLSTSVPSSTGVSVKRTCFLAAERGKNGRPGEAVWEGDEDGETVVVEDEGDEHSE